MNKADKVCRLRTAFPRKHPNVIETVDVGVGNFGKGGQ